MSPEVGYVRRRASNPVHLTAYVSLRLRRSPGRSRMEACSTLASPSHQQSSGDTASGTAPLTWSTRRHIVGSHGSATTIDPASSWAALVVGRSVPRHARSAACIALDVGVYVLAALGILGTWQDRASLSDPECTDVDGFVYTLSGGLLLTVLQKSLGWLRSRLVGCQLRRYQQLSLLTPSHMVRSSRALRQSDDVAQHGALGLPMLLLLTWLWSNAVDDGSPCLASYPELARAFYAYTWAGRALAMVFVACSGLGCFSILQVVRLLQLEPLTARPSAPQPVRISAVGDMNAFLDLTFKAAASLLSGSREEPRGMRAWPQLERRELLEGRGPRGDMEAVGSGEGLQAEEEGAAEDEEDEREEQEHVEEEREEEGEEARSWNVLQASLWLALHVAVAGVCIYTALTLMRPTTYHVGTCTRVEGLLVSLTAAFSGYLLYTTAFCVDLYKAQRHVTTHDLMRGVWLARLLLVLLACAMFGGFFVLNDQACFDASPGLLDPVLAFVLLGSCLVLLGLGIYAFFLLTWALGSLARILLSLQECTTLVLSLLFPCGKGKGILGSLPYRPSSPSTSPPSRPFTPTASIVARRDSSSGHSSSSSSSSSSSPLTFAQEVPLPYFRVVVLAPPCVGPSDVGPQAVRAPMADTAQAFTRPGLPADPLDSLFDVVPCGPLCGPLLPSTRRRRDNPRYTVRPLSPSPPSETLPTPTGGGPNVGADGMPRRRSWSRTGRHSFSDLQQRQLGPLM